MESVTLSLTGAQLSDLFFNYEHPNRDEAYKRYANQKDSPTADELRASIFADAVDFVEFYGIPVEPTALADDFESRV